MMQFELQGELYIQPAVKLQLELWLQTRAVEKAPVFTSPSAPTTLQPSWEGKGREGKASQNIYIVFAYLPICIIFTGRPPRSLSSSTKERPCDSEIFPKIRSSQKEQHVYKRFRVFTMHPLVSPYWQASNPPFVCFA